MCATLFLTYADVEMSKVVTSLINKDKLNMVELRAQIRALEVQRILPNYQVPLEEQDQMELLEVGSGTLTEKCRFKKDAETKPAQAELKAKKAEANKKKK